MRDPPLPSPRLQLWIGVSIAGALLLAIWVEVLAPVQQGARGYWPIATLSSLFIVSVSALVLRTLARQRKHLDSLAAAEARLRSIFNQTLVGIALANRSGRFVKVNQALCQMLGYTEPELWELTYLDITHHADREQTAARMRVLEERDGEPFTQQAAKRYVRKDGSTLWALTSVSLIRGEDGTSYYSGMVQDISEMKRVERIKNEFVSTVSHELRTPLTSIHGSLGLLAGGVAGPLSLPARELVTIGARNCERLIRLVNDILDTDRIETGRMRIEAQVGDMRALVKHALDCNEGFAREHGVRVTFARPDQPAYARVDPDRFNQVMTNLLSNAVRFSPRGSTVEVRLAASHGRVRVEVADLGPGIPEDFRRRIFRPFSQADSSDSRRRGGNGLGLYIAKGIVERLGGCIGYDSAVGRGATFFVEFPLESQPLSSGERIARQA